jgi:hypothetical protein
MICRCTNAVSSLYAQTINQQIVVNDLIFEFGQLINVPVAAQKSAPGPISLAGAKPNSEPGCQIGLVYKYRVKFLGHVLRQVGGNTSWIDGKALDTIFAMINIDKFAQTIDRMLGRLIVRGRRRQQLSASGGDKDQMATG